MMIRLTWPLKNGISSIRTVIGEDGMVFNSECLLGYVRCSSTDSSWSCHGKGKAKLRGIVCAGKEDDEVVPEKSKGG